MIIPQSTPYAPLWEVVRKVPVLMGISTRTYEDKYTYLWRQVHVLISIGYFSGLSFPLYEVSDVILNFAFIYFEF